jgi:hypothetical protein
MTSQRADAGLWLFHPKTGAPPVRPLTPDGVYWKLADSSFGFLLISALDSLRWIFSVGRRGEQS